MTDVTSRISTALADHYQIESRLGEGGMATVYLAEDLKHDRKVALKVLKPELAAVLGAERFVQEIKTTASLQHPHILPLFDSGQAGDRADGQEFLYYVMPYIDGETLREKLDRETQLSIEEAVRITTEVADALDYAHRHGVIHRDIKPENILLHDGRPMVADFGIALAIDAGGPRLTETGVSIGTPHYMSPEQVTGDWEVDSRSDVYALGAVLYEMVTGRAPHTGNTAQAVIARMLTDAPVPAGELREELPGSVETAVHRSLAKTPADRFQSAAAFATALIEDKDQPRVPRSAKRSRVATRITSAVAAVIVVLAMWVFGPWAGRSTGIASVAVLPLANLSGDSSQAHFVDGIHDALIGELQQLSAFERVISRTSVMQYRDTERTVPEIATALGVDAVIDGTVQRAGNTVNVRVTLVGAFPERNLWSDNYQGSVEDVLTQQRAIAGDIAREIALTLTPAEEAHLAEARPVDPAAFNLVLMGREAWNLRNGSSLRRAVALFEQALAIDSAYPEVHAGLSDAYNMLTQYEEISPEEGIPLAIEYAERALALDSTSSGAYTSLGEIHFLRRDWGQAELAYRRAIDLGPGSAIGHHFYGWFLSHLGRHDDAIRMLRRARDLDPLSGPISADLAAVYLHARRYDEAWEETERTLGISPGFRRAAQLQVLLDVLWTGNVERAIATAEQLGEFQFAGETLAHALAAAGRHAEARDHIEEDISEAGGIERLPKSAALIAASVYLELGDSTTVWALLDRAVESELGAGFTSLVVWPFFDPLRDDPRYADLMDRMGYPD